MLEAVRRYEAEEEARADGEERPAGRPRPVVPGSSGSVIHHQQGSTSLLQRRLKIGYGRAARIIDQLQAAGVLGAQDGSKPREDPGGSRRTGSYLPLTIPRPVKTDDGCE